MLEGYNGLLEPDDYSDGGLIEVTRDSAKGITHLGGTILGTTNRGNPFAYPVTGEDGVVGEVDRTDELIEAFRRHQIAALVAIGGGGSLSIYKVLASKGLRVVGVPKTIDNDLHQTVITFGFDTAVSFATHCLDRLQSTAESHQRIMVVEVMGRYAGWIALSVGISGSADAILIPEIQYDLEKSRPRSGRVKREARNTRLSLPPRKPSPWEAIVLFWKRKSAGRSAWVESGRRWLPN
jgi:6-phosphofructokinase